MDTALRHLLQTTPYLNYVTAGVGVFDSVSPAYRKHSTTVFHPRTHETV